MYIWNYVKSELNTDQPLDYKETEINQKRENVYLFLRLPLSLEKFMLYGFLQCADSFLFVCSLLPLRIFTFLFNIIKNPFKL